jgi:ABC-type polysaccharide/polyol phosphate transport system ATPase subunit
MYMRLGFSVAVHVDPEILLIDEVLGVGDFAFTNKCMQRMDQFKAAGKTIVLVTHNPGLAARWCDEALWLDHGTVKAIGAAATVSNAYVQAYSDCSAPTASG